MMVAQQNQSKYTFTSNITGHSCLIYCPTLMADGIAPAGNGRKHEVGK